MNELFKLFGTIAINNAGANKAIDETGQKANRLHNITQKAFNGIGKAAVACGKAVAAGLAVSAAAVGALMKASIGNYAEYEQLVGGVETLFKDSSDAVMKYAKNAYKTAGLSANDYMSTVTSFSASLLQGLGGDTAAAAEMANLAITDMSDNANKMGTDMGMIQNAYQGFAKQNYTMLDNLKLGYGGTQSEMARLINDSGVLGDTIKVTAETVNEVSFSKIIEAIHVVQTEMGITGTTAKEATETISGSFNTWKSSWTNLMTGMADDENIEPLVDAFFDAGQTVLKNIGKVLPKIGKNIAETMRIAGQHVRTLWTQELWPEIQKFAKVNFGIDLPEWSEIETQVSIWWSSISEGMKGLVDNASGIFASLGSIISQIFPDISTLGTLLSNTTTNVKSFAEDVTGLINDILAWVSENKETMYLIETAIAAAIVAFAPLQAIIAVIIANWNTIAAAIDLAIGAIGEFFTQTIPEAWKKFVHEIGKWWYDNVFSVVNLVATAIDDFFTKTIPEAWKTMVEGIQTWWNDHVVTPINNAIAAVQAFLGIDSEKTVTVNVKTNIDNMPINDIRDLIGGQLYGEIPGINYTDGGDQGTGHAHGLDYVPKDNYRARLHLGEMVLPRNEAEHYRKGGSSPDMGGLEAAISNLIALTQQVVSNTAAGNSIYLDGGVLVGRTARLMDAELGNITGRKGRRV